MWFYYGANRGLVRFPNPDEPEMPKRATEFNSGVGLAKIKRDRFVGIAPDPQASLRNWNPNDPLKKPEPKANSIGQVTLKARDLTSVTRIEINANASQGSIRLEVLNEDGYRLRGFTKDDAIAMTTDEIAFAVEWNQKKISDLPPGQYMLRIHLQDAELFAIKLKNR
jgi:hypothetical protein